MIETERLVLRGWRDEDVEGWADMCADPRVMEFFPSVTPREEARAAALRMRADLERNGYGWFVMDVKAQPGFAGVLILAYARAPMPFTPLQEIGWRLPVHAWGHGYATEGSAALLRYGFDVLQWPEIVSFTAAINERSQRVMQRLGMTHDPADDFDHPRVPEDSPLRRHVLYRKRA